MPPPLKRLSSPPSPSQPASYLSPAKLLNLSSNWKIQLPYPAAPQNIGSVIMEIFQPQLYNYSDPRYFFVNANATAVVFLTNAGGMTTSGSMYPRTELREMNGSQLASWNVKDSTLHTMELRGALIRYTPVKHAVCVSQLKGPNGVGELNTLAVVVYGNSKGNIVMLNVNINNGKSPTKIPLDSNYVLGSKYHIKYVVGTSSVKVYYGLNDATLSLKASFAANYSQVYFKAGNYLQSNLATGEAANSTAEVWIYSLSIY